MSAKYMSSLYLLLGISLLSFGQDTVLYCQRSTDTCNLNKTGLFWSKAQQFSVHNLRGAVVEGDGDTDKVTIVTSGETIPMTDISYSPGGQSETARQINNFVQQKNHESLRVYENTLVMSVILGIFIIIVGVFMLQIK
jgi:hypothetical protein